MKSTSIRSSLALVVLIACLHAGLWMLFERQEAAAKIDGPLSSLSYNPFGRAQHPEYGERATAEQIRSDLRLLRPYTRAVRTYSSAQGVEQVPAIAAEFGLKVTVGIWLSLSLNQTAQGGLMRNGSAFPAFWEAVIAALLLTGASLVIITNHMGVHEVNIFALALAVQSLPFLAACAPASLKG